MKIKMLVIASVVSCLVLPSAHAAGFFFGISDGHHGHRPHHARFHRPMCRTVVVRERVSPVVVSCNVPYGEMRCGRVYSPWSDFSMSVGGRASGETVYDPNNGRPFRIP